MDEQQLSASDAYVALRWALRDMLGRAGVASNPGWSDQEIVDALATRVGVTGNFYADAYRAVTHARPTRSRNNARSHR